MTPRRHPSARTRGAGDRSRRSDHSARPPGPTARSAADRSRRAEQIARRIERSCGTLGRRARRIGHVARLFGAGARQSGHIARHSARSARRFGHIARRAGLDRRSGELHWRMERLVSRISRNARKNFAMRGGSSGQARSGFGHLQSADKKKAASLRLAPRRERRRGAVRPLSLPEYAVCARSARRRTRAGLPGPGCVRSP